MIAKYREQFNREFNAEKYNQVIESLTEKGGIKPPFRVSESPVFLTEEFRSKLQLACDSIITQIKNMSEAELGKAVPEQYLLWTDHQRKFCTC